MELVKMGREYGSSLGAPTAMPESSVAYPYGLRLCLTHEELAKLGYEDLPPAGTMLHIEAIACVVKSSSEDPDADGDVDYCSIDVQITELGLEEHGESEDEDDDDDGEEQSGRADRLYKGKQPA